MKNQFTPRSLKHGLALSVAVPALLAGAVGTAAAQSPTAAPASDTGDVQTVIVTAQRRREDIQHVPVSITSISSAQIQALGIRSTDDIGQSIPNVSILSPNGPGQQPSIVIRGIGVNDFDTNNPGPNGVYVDDVFISAPSAQSFGVFDLDQIQVLKGPQGTLYGRNTSGGAIVFTSKKPTDTLTADAHLEYGNFNTIQLTAGVGGPLTDKLDGRIAFAYNHSDGFEKNLLTDQPAGGTDNETVRGQLLYKPNENLKVLFSATIGYLHNLPFEYIQHGVFQPGTQGLATPTVCPIQQINARQCVDLFGNSSKGEGFYDGKWSRTNEMHNLNQVYQLRLDYKLNTIDLTSISAYQYDNKYHPEDSDAGPLDTVRSTFGARSGTFTQEFRAAHNSDYYHWVVGAYYLHEDLYQNQPLSLFYNGDLYGGLGIPAGAGSFDNTAEMVSDKSHQTTDAPALYGQGDYTYQNFTLTLGGRVTYEKKSFSYDQFSQFQEGGLGNYGAPTGIISDNVSQEDTDFTWKAGLSYAFSRNILAYASVATGLKSGDFNGSFLSSNPQQAAFQLQPVKPEHVTAYEVGAKTSYFDRRLIFNVAAFYNDYKDEQIFAQVPQTITTGTGQEIQQLTNILANAKQAHTEGVEFEATARPIPELTISLQPAFLDARLDNAGLPGFSGESSLNGKQAANAPRFSFAGNFNYRVPLANGDSVTVRWNSSYKSHVYFSPTDDPYIQQGGVWLHNFNVDYQLKQGVSVGAYVRNLSGSKYYVNGGDLSSPFGEVSGVPGAPRTFGVELNYSY